MDAPCSTRTIRRHLNYEKIKHKKRIHRLRLTMKHKEKRLEYDRQYQTMSAKECRKVVFSDEKKFNLDGPHAFQKYWHTKIFQKRITQQDIVEEDRLWSGGGVSSLGKLKLQFVSARQKGADYVKMLNDLSLAQEGRRLCRKEWIFSKIMLQSTMYQ